MCGNRRDPRTPDERWRDQRKSNDEWLRRRRQQNDSLWPFFARLTRRQPAGQEHPMCKSPEPDTSPEAKRAADAWFREKRRDTQRRTGRMWPPFAALPRAILRRLTTA